METIDQLKDSILKVMLTRGFEESEARSAINEAVHEQDPFNWAHNASYTIIVEGSAIPDGIYQDFEFWLEVNEELSYKGSDMFCENVNAAVVAVYNS